MFATPLSPAWIPSDAVRDQLERAARGKGSVDDDCFRELRRTVQSGETGET